MDRVVFLEARRAGIGESGVAPHLRHIPGYPGYYASADGLIWSTRAKCGGGPGSAPAHRVAQRLNRQGYFRVNLCIDNRRTTRTVHTLVTAAFLGPKPPGLVVCHRNGVKTDCRADNLRWGTHQSNSDDMREHGTILAGERHPRARLTAETVAVIRSAWASGGFSLRGLARKFGVSKSSICHIVSGRQWKEVSHEPC